jgi:uncharacterized GH25 family protein
MKLILSALLGATLLHGSAAAHDFWLQPARFSAASATPLKINFMIGHGNEVEPWNLTWERMHSLRSYGPDGLVDHQASIIPTTANNPGGATIALTGAGTHMVVMESYHSTSDLPAKKFNDYAELEGLTAAIEHRRRTGALGKPGREVYSRRAKTLVQVGDTVTDHPLRPIGLTLEIIPERNPYAPATTTKFPVRVFLHGKPLAGALIDLTALGSGTEPTQGQRTDADGRATFDIPRAGAWKINTIWARPVEGRPDTDFDTVFASLTFGY